MNHRKSTFGSTDNLWTPAAGTTNRPSMFARSGLRQQNFGRQSIAGHGIGGRISLTSDARCSLAGAPSFGARPSNFPGMSGRQSLAVPKILNQNEQRNIKDKQVQNEMIAKIQHFLADCVNPQPQFKFDDHNFLRIPGRTEFKNVFEFLMQQLQPSFQMVKFDEDKLLKVVNNLGYPHPFKLSHLQTMTGQSWPTMLSVLDWLIDIIEMDNQMHAKNKIRDVDKWQLLVSCYKRDINVRGRGNNTAAIPRPDFAEEFEAYKLAKLGEDERPDSYDERRDRRLACEKKLENVEKNIMEEKEKIAEIERGTADLETDIATLVKYNDDLAIKTSQIEQLLVQATEFYENLRRTIEQLNAENAEKERRIAGQKISGNEARQLLTERNSIREEIGLLRERMGKIESEIFEIQPNYFKISAQIRSDYSALISGLKGLCETFCNSVDAQKIITSLDQQNFEQIFEDIQKTDINDNKLAQLIAKLKELCDRKMLSYKQNEEEANQKMENLQKDIRELQSAKEQRQTKHELEIERAIREHDDKLRPENVQKHNLDLVRQKRQTTAETLNKHTGQLNELQEKLAVKHTQYIDFKRQLDSNYNDLQSAVLENVSKLCERLQQIEDQKVLYKQLGEEMLNENKEALKKLKGDKGPKQ